MHGLGVADLMANSEGGCQRFGWQISVHSWPLANRSSSPRDQVMIRTSCSGLETHAIHKLGARLSNTMIAGCGIDGSE